MVSSWALDVAQREDMVQRIAASMATMSWARGARISGEDAQAKAAAIERKAYTAAQVGATTTTGARPAAENVKAYARKLSELLLEAVKTGEAASTQQADQGAAGAEFLDLSVSGREFFNKENAEEELKPLLAQGSSIKRIKFSTKSFGRDAAAVAARGIANVSATLTDADISDVIAGRPEDEALDALRTLCHALGSVPLRRLNLSDNALGEKGVRACAEAFSRQAGLESISLQNVGCSIHACRAVQELLTMSGELRQIHLFNNMTDDAGAEAIAQVLGRAPRMEDFKLASSRVGPAGGAALSRGLSAGYNLVRLDLSDNPMTADVAPALASCLSHQRNLRFLNLNDTSLTDKGVKAICGALSAEGATPLLEELELALNEITPTGAKAVALAMAGKLHLSKVNMRENELEDAGAVTLSRVLATLPAVRSVDVVGNQLRRVGAVALARVVAGWPGFEMLSLDENNISEAGVEEVKRVLAEAGKAATLGPLDDNDPEGDGEDDDNEDGEEAEDDNELTTALARFNMA